jgi:hypothetical protein
MSALYPVACGWCHGPVMEPGGWLVHRGGVCLMLEDIGDPPCRVTVKEDVYRALCGGRVDGRFTTVRALRPYGGPPCRLPRRHR